jgi:hypothetical protein
MNVLTRSLVLSFKTDLLIFQAVNSGRELIIPRHFSAYHFIPAVIKPSSEKKKEVTEIRYLL